MSVCSILFFQSELAKTTTILKVPLICLNMSLLENKFSRGYENIQYLEFSSECVLPCTPHLFIHSTHELLISCHCAWPQGQGSFFPSTHSIELSHSLESDLPSCRLTRISLIWLRSSWLYSGLSGAGGGGWPWLQGRLSPATSALEQSPGKESTHKASCSGSFSLF